MLKLGLGAHVIPQSVLINKNEVQINSNLPMEYGGYASVHEGSYRGNRIAVKRLRCPISHRYFDQEPVIREVLMWRTLSHDYVLPFIGTYGDSGFIHLVSPLMENETLHNWRNEKNPSASEVEIMTLRVAEGVQYMHYEGVIHCDLRGVHVLLDSNLRVRIADFGLSRDSNAPATVESKHFAAPELLVDEDKIRHTKKTDIYAFGCLYYEIHFNSLPFGTNTFYAVQQVKEGKHPPRKPNPPLEDEAWNLIERCWDQNPIKRPSIDDVVDIMISWRRKSSDCESEWDDDSLLEEDNF
ncbi:kinase-like domain-containing protein [Amanita rubescens]|nr:kinase-like domain-containing protein [Amanita rubescens]